MEDSMKKCPKCGSDRIDIELVDNPQSPHYAKARCLDCHFFTWIPKPKKQNKRPPNKRLKPEIRYCEICFRTNVLLEEHHIIPYNKRPDLDKDINNRLVLCHECHLLVHQIQKIAGVV